MYFQIPLMVLVILPALEGLRPAWREAFAGWGSFRSVIHQSGFAASLGLSVRLAVITTVITLALMLPTAVYVQLRLPRLRRLLEGITILPIVIPPIVLIVGLLQVAPGFLKSTGRCDARRPARAGRGAGRAVRAPRHGVRRGVRRHDEPDPRGAGG